MLRFTIFAAAALLCLTTAQVNAQTSAEEQLVNQLITQLLQDKDLNKRRLALMKLEIYPRGKGVVQAVTTVLQKDQEQVLRCDAAVMLGIWGEDAKAAAPALGQALKTDKHALVREMCARALLQMVPHSKTAIPQLADALSEPNPSTRAYAAETIKALSEYAKPILPRLMDFLTKDKNKSEGPEARMHIVAALGSLGDNKAVSVLLTVVADPLEDNMVRVAAADGLGRFGLDAVGAAKPLAGILAEAKNDLSLRLAAAKALSKVEGETKQIWPALKVGLADGDITLRVLSIRAAGPYGKAEKEVVTTLAKLGRTDSDVEVRLAAIQELGLLGPAAKAAEADLRYIMDNDERDPVRQEAETALQKIGKSIPS